MAKAMPDPGTTVCPRCNINGIVRLLGGDVCAECHARTAWEQADGQCLVIDMPAIEAAEVRRRGEAAGEPARIRLLAWAPTLVAAALGVIATVFLVRTLKPRPIGPLGEVFGGLLADSMTTTLFGAGAFVCALLSAWRLKRGRHFRRISMLFPTLLALAAGVASGLVGGVHLLGAQPHLKFLTMPVRLPLAEPSPVVERIMEATCAIVSPGADGDARAAALGTGSVIAVKGDQVFVLTNSHVAMPYAAVGAWRHASQAQPVWLQFADGRQTIAKVRWTARPPLDVAVIQATMANAPRPVEISPDSEGLVTGSPVTFVPNPYRDGWLVHRGRVQRREEHDTPAGVYSLLFTDLPVVPGDSGSGLYDAQGRLVGLNTWTRMGGGAAPQGISLPSETMRAVVEAISADRIDALDEKLR